MCILILALSQERPEILECYECDPTNLQIRDPSKTGLHSTRMTCLTDDDDLGELKQCSLLNGLCAVGKIGTLSFGIHLLKYYDLFIFNINFFY